MPVQLRLFLISHAEQPTHEEAHRAARESTTGQREPHSGARGCKKATSPYRSLYLALGVV
jgi:hypothetical protein